MILCLLAAMFAAVWSPSSAAEPAERADYVAGKLIIFNDNGAWSWFQDERVIADPVAGTLLIGSVANRSGAGGMARDGNTEVAAYSWQSGALHVTALHERLEADDHNAPALMIRPDGHYLAVYAKHNGDRLTRWRVSADPHDATRWRDEQTFDWFQPPASIGKSTVTYSNVFNLSAESRTYDFARAVNRDPAFLVSTDDGSTWSYGGKLLTEQPLGYVNGYVKYASNNIDRIDFITTEHHPFYFNNSIYHGYIRGGKIHRSDGTVVDESIFDATAPAAADLTQVFAAGTVVDGGAMSRCWTTDLALGPEQHPYALFTCRANDVPENSHFDDHRFFYARFDGTTWNVHQLAKAGASLWSWERDYVGGGAVDPQDRSVVYISAAIDPRDAAKLAHHEIFRGATADGGSTWTWRPITRNSSVENLRPVVPQWYSGRTALVWCRGTMRNSQDYDMQIVGIIEPR